MQEWNLRYAYADCTNFFLHTQIYDGLMAKLFETLIESYNLLNLLTNVAHKGLDWTAYILSVIKFFDE